MLSAFQLFLDYKDMSEAKVKAGHDEHMSDFLDFLTGQRQQSDSECSGRLSAAFI